MVAYRSDPLAIAAAVAPGVVPVLFDWESFSLADVLRALDGALSPQQPRGGLASLGLLSMGKPGTINIVQCSRTSLWGLQRPDLREFWVALAAHVRGPGAAGGGGTLHLLGDALEGDADGEAMASYIQGVRIIKGDPRVAFCDI